ncbi:MAG: Gfo/Idh/MocA family protein [Promethearchaeota archaeon]
MNIGIIGCGAIAESHTRIIKGLMKNINLFLCDIDKSKAEKLANRYKIQNIYTNVDELISKEKLHTAHILTPLSDHFEIAKKALRAGCHIYIEKPITESIIELKDLLDLAKNKEKVICAGYSALSMPAILKAKREIDSGKFGRVIAIHCDFMCSEQGNLIPYRDPNHWAYSLRGGILQNMADHPASLVIDVIDGVNEYNLFFSRRNFLPNDCPDIMHVAMQNEDQIGSFTLYFGKGNSHRYIQYFLERGTIIVDMTRQLVSYIRNQGPQNFIKKTMTGIKIGWNFAGGSVFNVYRVIKGSLERNPGIVNLIKNFYNTINGKEELIVKHATVISVVSILEEIWKEINYSQS